MEVTSNTTERDIIVALELPLRSPDDKWCNESLGISFKLIRTNMGNSYCIGKAIGLQMHFGYGRDREFRRVMLDNGELDLNHARRKFYGLVQLRVKWDAEMKAAQDATDKANHEINALVAEAGVGKDSSLEYARETTPGSSYVLKLRNLTTDQVRKIMEAVRQIKKEE